MTSAKTNNHLSEDVSEPSAEAELDERNAIVVLEELADFAGGDQLFTYLFFWSLAKGSLGTSGANTSPVEIEHLAYYLVPKFQSNTEGRLNPFVGSKALQIAEVLSSVRNKKLIVNACSRSDPPGETEFIKNMVIMETSFVRGSAYPELTANEINDIQGKFDKWFETRVGISPSRAVTLVWKICQEIDEHINSMEPALIRAGDIFKRIWEKFHRNHHLLLTSKEHALLSLFHSRKDARVFGSELELCKIIFWELPVKPEDIATEPAFTTFEWKALQNLIGCSRDTRRLVTSPLDMCKRPLIVLADNRVLLGDPSNALDQIWRAYEEIARAEPQFYAKDYQPTRAKWLENKTTLAVSKIFPKDHIYRQLIYPDPDKTPGNTTELDIAIYWEPFLIFIEVKAAQFRLESQMGDVGRLRTDLKKNIEDAFSQARRALRYLESQPDSTFIEKQTGRKLKLQHSALRRIYLMTVSQHHLGSFVTHLATLNLINLFLEKEYPWALSISDLDVVTDFCEGPDIFLHYAEKRVALQRGEILVVGDEMEFFGAYLNSRLRLEEIGPSGATAVNHPCGFIFLSNFQNPLDEVYDSRRRQTTIAPDVRLNIPQEIGEVLETLRKQKSSPEARWIAFTLLTLSEQALNAVAKMFREMRATQVSAKMLRKLVCNIDDTVFVGVLMRNVSVERLRFATEQEVLLEKYRGRLQKGIGFGLFLTEESRPFHCAILADFPWVQDDEWETLLIEKSPPIPISGAKMPERNHPCFCGSGTKYKKCCEPKNAKARWQSTST
jgi:hypothetical protein